MANALPLTIPDLVCWDDADPFARETTSDLATLFQDFYHLIIEAQGSNIDVPDRGVGISDRLSGTVSALNSAASEIDRQAPLYLAPRVDSCTTTISVDNSGAEPVYTIASLVGVNGVVYGTQFAFAPGAGLSVVSTGGMA